MKTLWVQLSFSVLLVGIVTALYIWEVDGTAGERVWSGIAVSVWAFSIPPACVFADRWFKRTDPAQAFRIGFMYGGAFDFNSFCANFVVPILAAPILMVRYYIGVFRGAN